MTPYGGREVSARLYHWDMRLSAAATRPSHGDGRLSGLAASERLVSPTGFEPVLPAPEAGALSGLSYGDTAELDYRHVRDLGSQRFATYLTDSVTAVTPLIDGRP